LGNKLIRNFACTNTAAHDFNQFETLLTPNSSRDLWADSAYRSKEKETTLDAANFFMKQVIAPRHPPKNKLRETKINQKFMSA
jgi:hypothetical protein